MQLILPEGFKEGPMEEATLVRVLRRGVGGQRGKDKKDQREEIGPFMIKTLQNTVREIH